MMTAQQEDALGKANAARAAIARLKYDTRAVALGAPRWEARSAQHELIAPVLAAPGHPASSLRVADLVRLYRGVRQERAVWLAGRARVLGELRVRELNPGERARLLHTLSYWIEEGLLSHE